jgi:hypothetical protein
MWTVSRRPALTRGLGTTWEFLDIHDIVGPIRDPRDLTDAQFSANFSVALYLVTGGLAGRVLPRSTCSTGPTGSPRSPTSATWPAC